MIASLAMSPEAFRAWMDRQGVTVAQLASDLEVGERTIYRWRSGEIRITKLVELALGAYESSH